METYQASRSKKTDFLEQTKAAREERQKEKLILTSAIKIQALVRGFLCRRRVRHEFLNQFHLKIVDWNEEESRPLLIDRDDAFSIFKAFLFIYNRSCDRLAFEKMCKYIISSMFNDQSISNDYVTVAFDKKRTNSWIYQIKRILYECCLCLKESRPEVIQFQSSMMLHLNMLITFTSCSTWKVFNDCKNKVLHTVMQRICCNILNNLVDKGFYECLQELLMKCFCRSQVLIKKSPLVATLSLTIRPLVYNEFNSNTMNLFLRHILSVPALVYHTNEISKDVLTTWNKYNLFDHMIKYLDEDDELRLSKLFDQLEANYMICLLGNLIHLGYLNIDRLKTDELTYMKLNSIVKLSLQQCEKFVLNRHTSLTHWHPLLGWFAQNIDERLHSSLGCVKLQFQLFWNPQMVQLIHSHLIPNDEQPLLKEIPASLINCYANSLRGSTSNSYPAFLKKAMDLVRTNSNSSPPSTANEINDIRTESLRKYFNENFVKVSEICLTYTTAVHTLTQLKLDILTGLCYNDLLLPCLWKSIQSLNLKKGMEWLFFLQCLNANTTADSAEFHILILFCDCATHLITILDDRELYEEQKLFSLDDLIAISSFLNEFVYRLIAWKQIDLKSSPTFHSFFNSLHALLMLLYRRDSRREFCPKEHWLVRDLKVSTFMKDIEATKKYAIILLNKIPHVVPHKERVMLFRKYVANEKSVLGLTESICNTVQPTLITVHRSRILEDGYQQLNKLPNHALKGLIRVKFINEQGLDEAGIDQDGVFKEFLEETMKKMFNPSLNLFSLTSEQRLYPSSTSNLHENYLSLFEFVGKILGKAVYEGIVIDAPFASFFLNQLLPSQHNMTTGSALNQTSLLYSSIDQLPSLDAELYKSLTYIKHYDGDVADLNLTFSLMEDRLGQLVTFELIPGGKSINVTKENKIAYIHLMAHFRMRKQIDEQCNAFVRGFRTIVSPDWLSMFSTPELQRLISGDNTPIDLIDLRRNTRYYGGFHNNHRLINWFWDILQNDLTNEELGLFLKFVTSCSKPPLLGFAYLQPPFTIRCVEVGEDVDDGDTLGSILRGFFTINSNLRLGSRKGETIIRLPTSSTCFNLLKLPNYQRKSTLRDKLRYAINSHTGFELS